MVGQVHQLPPASLMEHLRCNCGPSEHPFIASNLVFSGHAFASSYISIIHGLLDYNVIFYFSEGCCWGSYFLRNGTRSGLQYELSVLTTFVPTPHQNAGGPLYAARRLIRRQIVGGQ